MESRSSDRAESSYTQLFREPIKLTLQWNRDDSIAERLGVRTTRINPTPALQWNRDHAIAERRDCRISVLSDSLLQWNRDHAIAKSGNLHADASLIVVASMEPRSFDRGEPGNRRRRSLCSPYLNRTAIL